jgi:hypothetical protein
MSIVYKKNYVIEKQVGASVVIYTRSVEIEVTMGAHVKI